MSSAADDGFVLGEAVDGVEMTKRVTLRSWRLGAINFVEVGSV
jgi:hypothetical protein